MLESGGKGKGEEDEPSSVTSSGKLNGESMVAPVVSDHRDPPEAESVASTKLDHWRESSDLGELGVGVDVLGKEKEERSATRILRFYLETKR